MQTGDVFESVCPVLPLQTLYNNKENFKNFELSFRTRLLNNLIAYHIYQEKLLNRKLSIPYIVQ